MTKEFDTIARPEFCRMEVKIWLSGDNSELEAEFLMHSLACLISETMSESPLIRYTLTPDNMGHVEYPKES